MCGSTKQWLTYCLKTLIFVGSEATKNKSDSFLSGFSLRTLGQCNAVDELSCGTDRRRGGAPRRQARVIDVSSRPAAAARLGRVRQSSAAVGPARPRASR